MKTADFRADIINATRTNCKSQPNRRRFVAHVVEGHMEAILTCEFGTNYRIALWDTPRKRQPAVWGVDIKSEAELREYLKRCIRFERVEKRNK